MTYFKSGSTVGYFGWCHVGRGGTGHYQFHACVVTANILLALQVVTIDTTLVMLSKKEEG